MDFFIHLGDEDIKAKIRDIDWEGRLYTPGLPPKPEFDTTLANECYELAAKWEDSVRLNFLKDPHLFSSYSYFLTIPL